MVKRKAKEKMTATERCVTCDQILQPRKNYLKYSKCHCGPAEQPLHLARHRAWGRRSMSERLLALQPVRVQKASVLLTELWTPYS